MLEDAPTVQIVFEDQRVNEVEKIDQRDLVISNKPSLISHVKVVIPNEFNDVKIKAFMFTKVVEELLQSLNMQILVFQHSKV